MVPYILMPALAVPAPVDYPALRRMAEEAIAAVQSDLEARRKAGEPREQLRPDLDKALVHLRHLKASAQGELKEACLVAELQVVTRYLWKSDLADQIFQAVPPESPAWQAANAEMLMNLAPLLGSQSSAFIQRMEAKGLPSLRPAVLAGMVLFHLEEGRPAEAENLLARLKAAWPKDPSVLQAAEFLEADRATAVGAQAPDFSLASLDQPDRNFTKAAFKGRYLMLEFWATWCGPCMKELPATHKAYARFHGKGLEILSLSMDRSPADVTKQRNRPETPMPWNHAFVGTGGSQPPVVRAYRADAIPALFLIGPDGRIAARGEELRGPMLEKTLSRLLE